MRQQSVDAFERPAAERRAVRVSLLLGVVLLGLAGAAHEPLADACSTPGWLVSVGPIPHAVCTPSPAHLGASVPPLSGASGLLFGRGLDLNTASVRSLEVLPGIGPQRAEAIARERRAAPFGSVEALGRVSGVGPRTIEGLAGWVRVGAPVGGVRAERTPAR